MLEKLSSSLKGTIWKIARAKRIDKRMLDEIVRDIQRALIQADVKISLVKELSSRIRERSLKEKLALNPREHVIKVVYEELINILGRGVEVPLAAQKIMMVGLHGSGKTSSCAKLARYFQKKGLKPAVICADVYRPAASDQLRQLCDKIGVPFYDGANLPDRNVIGIVKAGVKEFEKYDVEIIDTAGRHALEEDMIEEIRDIKESIKPDQRFLILDASIGQQASVQAKAFDDAIGITGIIITKMDGTAKGGGALSAVSETNSGVAFIGTGEKIDDFEKFEPDGFISRLLGMGDIKSLIEMAEESLKPEDVDVDILKGKFTLKDLYKQLEAVKKMGPMKKIMQMLPLGGLGFDIDFDDTMYQVTEDKLKKFKVMMDSMTEEELTEPKVIDGSRLKRIARGSGTTTAEVNELIKYHRMMQKMMKSMTSRRGAGKIPMKGMKIPMGKMLKRMK
ncbi:MAG: signal recognition particle protein Srp54 [Methanophagales archaeon]|nr:signal recognition particle protein Srp54 [Methanophagales archaeon]MCW3140710.1 signal recognition particle protein Srp54 [Methanophagales archaeon]